MMDEDLRREAVRLANVIIRLAESAETEFSMLPNEYRIGDAVAQSGDDRTITSWLPEQTRVSGQDADGPIALGFSIDRHYNEDGTRIIPPRPAGFVAIARMISGSMQRNERIPHDDLHIILGDDEAWRNALDIVWQTSLAHPDLTLRLSPDEERRMKIDIAASGAHGVIGPNHELVEAVKALTWRPMLTWRRAESGQALAKRRANGLPPMGLANISMAQITWKPHTKPAVNEGAAYVLRPAMPVARIPEVKIENDARFDWTLDDWEDVRFFSELKAEVQNAIEPILVVNERTMMQQLSLVRRSGRWVQRHPPRGTVPEISYEDAKTLMSYGVLTRRDESLVAGEAYHRLLRGLIATGYDSWKGVPEIRRVERVPNGIEYKPPYTYMAHSGRQVARLAPEGFTIERLGFDATKPTAARNGYAKAGLTGKDPLIAVIIRGGVAWPDFTRDIPSEIEGRLGVPCDPGLDHRDLPGPLGALYRSPTNDRILMRRHLRWQETQWQLPDWHDWEDRHYEW